MNDYQPPAITDIENAIIKAIADLKIFAAVKSYAGEFASEDFAQKIKQFPAFYVAYGGDARDPEERTDGFTEYPIFSTVIIARCLRGEAAARQGGVKNEHAHEYGAYDLLDAVKGTLVNSDLSLSIGKLKPLQTVPLFVGKASELQMAIYGIDFTTEILRTYPVSNDDLTGFKAELNPYDKGGATSLTAVRTEPTPLRQPPNPPATPHIKGN